MEIHHPVASIHHGAHAISTRNGTWYFVGPYGAKDAILSWRPGFGEPDIIDRVSPRQRYRGISGGRLVCVNEEKARILTIE